MLARRVAHSRSDYDWRLYAAWIQGIHQNRLDLCHIGSLLFALPAKADLADQLRKLVGYVILDSKVIAGWYDKKEKEDGTFNGCNYGRVIVFDDNTVLTCAGYGYHYAYRPTAVILAKATSHGGKTVYDYKMVVENEVYDMRR